ncbi:MAG TPA: NERD domain-containing protein [Chryseolinea sp.]|nr:NERD domain-containing protein [Chryseolinea sp.]
MPVVFINNYPKNDLESAIRKSDGTPLFGEIWFYNELSRFNELKLLGDENWYVKHNYNLSSHPSSSSKVEGQIDFLIISRFGILIVEIKGGGIEVDENDVYYTYDRADPSRRYVSQNPFIQAKEYLHSLRALLDTTPFIYRSVIFPHEAGFELKGPQLLGYSYLFFSRRNLERVQSRDAKTQMLFDFLIELAKESRRNVIAQMNTALRREKIEEIMWRRYPEVDSTALKRLKSELFPVQQTYGFDPNRIRDEILLEQNYEIVNGLKKNRRVMVEGCAGTGKTVLATKFLAEKLLKQHKGIYYCANKLLRARMEHIVVAEHRLDKNLIQFRVFNGSDSPNEVDFVIVDEAQEFFDKGLLEFIERCEKLLNRPKWLVLYDPEQAIMNDYVEIDWYATFYTESSWVHYIFETVWRCCKSRNVLEMTGLLRNGQLTKLREMYSRHIREVHITTEKLELIKDTLDSVKERYKCVILVHSELIEPFRQIVNSYFRKEVEELNEDNVNIISQKLKFTTPIKFRGLESESVVLITPSIQNGAKVQNYIGCTRAIYELNIVIWK